MLFKKLKGIAEKREKIKAKMAKTDVKSIVYI